MVGFNSGSPNLRSAIFLEVLYCEASGDNQQTPKKAFLPARLTRELPSYYARVRTSLSPDSVESLQFPVASFH